MAEIQNTYFIKKESLTAIGDAIRDKLGDDSTATYKVADMPGKIASISSGAVTQGSATTPKTTITITPTISVNTYGLITVSGSTTQSIKPTVVAGYVSEGTAGNVTASANRTKQLTTIGAGTYTPTTEDREIISSGIYTVGTQTIKGDSNLAAGNIKLGVTIFGVQGTYTGSSTSSGIDTSDVTAAAIDIRAGQTAYARGEKIVGTYVPSGVEIIEKTIEGGASFKIYEQHPNLLLVQEIIGFTSGHGYPIVIGSIVDAAADYVAGDIVKSQMGVYYSDSGYEWLGIYADGSTSIYILPDSRYQAIFGGTVQCVSSVGSSDGYGTFSYEVEYTRG